MHTDYRRPLNTFTATISAVIGRLFAYREHVGHGFESVQNAEIVSQFSSYLLSRRRIR